MRLLVTAIATETLLVIDNGWLNADALRQHRSALGQKRLSATALSCLCQRSQISKPNKLNVMPPLWGIVHLHLTLNADTTLATEHYLMSKPFTLCSAFNASVIGFALRNWRSKEFLKKFLTSTIRSFTNASRLSWFVLTAPLPSTGSGV